MTFADIGETEGTNETMYETRAMGAEGSASDEAAVTADQTRRAATRSEAVTTRMVS